MARVFWGASGFSDSLAPRPVVATVQCQGLNGVLQYSVYEKCGVRHTFVNPVGIRPLSNSPLQEIVFVDASKECIERLDIRHHALFFKVAAATVTRRMVVFKAPSCFIFQDESIAYIHFEGSRSFLKNS